MVIASIMLLNMALKSWVFPKADEYARYPLTTEQCGPKAPEGQSAPPVECSADYIAKMEEYDKQNRAAEKQRSAANAIAMFVVAAPVFFYHWRLARKEQ